MPAAALVPQEALDREFDLVHRVRRLIRPLRQPFFHVCWPRRTAWHTLIWRSQRVHNFNLIEASIVQYR